MQRLFTICAALFGLSGIALGAVAAHAIPDPVAAARITTASLYALIHAAVLLGWRGESAIVKGLLTAGTLLFSGSLAVTYLAHIPNALAPVGGSLLLLGWAGMLAVSVRGK